MVCLGGTVEEPRDWVRVLGYDDYSFAQGRTCRRQAPWTSPYTCSHCRLYRGIDRWHGRYGYWLHRWVGEQVTARWDMTGQYTGGVLTLTKDELREWIAAMDAAFDDDFAPTARLEAKMRGEAYGMDTLRRRGDPEALAWWAAQKRVYRKTHPEQRKRANEQRREYRKAHAEREREQARVRMARMRARRKADSYAVGQTPSRSLESAETKIGGDAVGDL